ncbi:asparagine synthase (glutamine-hydrolysing) [Fontimonas thermophila]|uniref:asparagine synthase (glutamine-hydrolyzing) n=1 Tax=Fontimonas thermophila TaxID=1076937 RepID=A0A1I2J1N3_9GAMM|nr:asparagine synthase (glutamine-hydrolyzing) [Fontimonas thermophila]SFF47920.1 asparagine synthase (glutamine-hydrolysing) [Fontimonas thermophila]
MCGIAGIVLREGRVAEAELARMAGTLTHRGPEDQGTYIAGRFGIAHTRLAIIDLAGGHQPLFDAHRRYALVCNGEIYNYVELRAELEAAGARPLTHSDSEVALHGFAHWGPASFKRLHGMYAYALYDHTAEELWLVRDRLGIKPLYIARLPDRLLFASELKALLPLMPRRTVHADALAQFFQNQFSTGAQTVIDGVERVPAGCALRIGPDLSVRVHRYWSALDVRPRRGLTYADAVAEWETLFAQVMREHMRADVPYGVFLSGGVDSAVLLGQLRRLHTQAVRTFSIGWADARQRDELDEAAAMARLFEAEHTPIRMDAAAVFRRLPRAVWAADDLMRDYACLPTLALAEAAGRELKVVFSGEGGDEVFAGYGRYRPDLFERTFKSLRYPGSGGFRVRPELDPRWVARLFVPALQPALAAYREPVVRAWAQTPRDWSHLQRRQYVDLSTNLPDDLLVKADRMLMSFSVEGRVPFLDHRVVEFGLSLPDELKIQRDAGKVFLKRWAESFIPRAHLWQHKRGFHVPVGEWLRGPFVAALAQKLPQSAAIRAWCRLPAVEALLARQQARGDVTREVFSLLQFAIWHRLFIDGHGAVPSAEEDPLAWIA